MDNSARGGRGLRREERAVSTPGGAVRLSREPAREHRRGRAFKPRRAPDEQSREVVNNAMALVEAQSEQLAGVLPKDYTIFSDELLWELLRTFNNSAMDDVGGDVIENWALAEKKQELFAIEPMR